MQDPIASRVRELIGWGKHDERGLIPSIQQWWNLFAGIWGKRKLNGVSVGVKFLGKLLVGVTDMNLNFAKSLQNVIVMLLETKYDIWFQIKERIYSPSPRNGCSITDGLGGGAKVLCEFGARFYWNPIESSPLPSLCRYARIPCISQMRCYRFGKRPPKVQLRRSSPSHADISYTDNHARYLFVCDSLWTSHFDHMDFDAILIQIILNGGVS